MKRVLPSCPIRNEPTQCFASPRGVLRARLDTVLALVDGKRHASVDVKLLRGSVWMNILLGDTLCSLVIHSCNIINSCILELQKP